MEDRTDLISSVLRAAGGEVVGKIRMQKIFYLLEQLGLGAGLQYSYHHYGPYSEDLAKSLDYAEMIKGAVREERRPSHYGSTFIAYMLQGNVEDSDNIGDIEWNSAARYISDMKSETSVVIELAATIHWLREKERVSDWNAELKRRKTSKAEPNLVHRAMRLLDKLELNSPV